MKTRLSKDYTDRCGNCTKYLGKEDQFCRYCGTKRGEGSFRPYEDMVQCVYGPPPEERFHKCKACGFEWTTNMMIDNQYYCPKCGGNCPPQELPAEEDELVELDQLDTDDAAELDKLDTDE